MSSKRRFGNVRRLPSGRWQARYLAPDGQAHTAPNTFPTKADATKYLATVEADLCRGQWRDHRVGLVTVGEWADRYLTAHSARLKPRTATLYRGLLTSCILPAFGTVPISGVQKIAVREWLTGLSAERGLSPSRVGGALRLLSQVMDAAVDDNLRADNPCRGVKPPRLPETEPRILTPAEVAALRASIREPYGVLVDVLAYGGLRIGEAFALRRRHVDLLRARLHVAESLSEDAGRHAFGRTKTHQAREVTLPPSIAADLSAYLDEHVPATTDALLFRSKVGKPLHYNAFRTWVWDPAVQSCGLHGVTPHDLRATCASWTADAFGIMEAARRLGHARSSVTTRHYARPLAGRDVDVAAGLDALRAADPEPRTQPVAL